VVFYQGALHNPINIFYGKTIKKANVPVGQALIVLRKNSKYFYTCLSESPVICMNARFSERYGF